MADQVLVPALDVPRAALRVRVGHDGDVPGEGTHGRVAPSMPESTTATLTPAPVAPPHAQELARSGNGNAGTASSRSKEPDQAGRLTESPSSRSRRRR